MTDRMDTEALRALVALGPLTVSHQNGDPEESFRGIVGPEVITRRGKGIHFYVAQYVLPENAPLFAQAPALAAEVLELRAKMTGYVQCEGCGCITDNPEKQLAWIKSNGGISCCPERKMLPLIATAQGDRA